MTGVIWVVQLLVYPAFRRIHESAWLDYHRHHTRSISFIVLPLMLAELFSGIALLILSQDGQRMQIALLAVIWFSTFAIQVPLHHQLAQGWDNATINRLIHTNWIRTVAWTAKSALALQLSFA